MASQVSRVPLRRRVAMAINGFKRGSLDAASGGRRWGWKDRRDDVAKLINNEAGIVAARAAAFVINSPLGARIAEIFRWQSGRRGDHAAAVASGRKRPASPGRRFHELDRHRRRARDDRFLRPAAVPLRAI